MGVYRNKEAVIDRTKFPLRKTTYVDSDVIHADSHRSFFLFQNIQQELIQIQDWKTNRRLRLPMAKANDLKKNTISCESSIAIKGHTENELNKTG